MGLCALPVAQFGTDALAGYGVGTRLEFLLVPIAFAVGVASVPLVGMAAVIPTIASSLAASSIRVFSPLIAATATFALNAGLWFRRGRLAMVFSSLAASCCRGPENPLIPPVQISGTASVSGGLIALLRAVSFCSAHIGLDWARVVLGAWVVISPRALATGFPAGMIAAHVLIGLAAIALPAWRRWSQDGGNTGLTA